MFNIIVSEDFELFKFTVQKRPQMIFIHFGGMFLHWALAPFSLFLEDLSCSDDIGAYPYCI